MARTVLVTGASRGIGRRVAELFVSSGDRVATLSRTGVAPEGVALSRAVDVADSAAVTAAVKEIVAELGALDVAVINAGVTDDGLAVRMSDEQWRRVLSVNLDGAFYSARAALASMIRHRQGSVIFVGSISPFLGLAGQANYAASKAGLVGLARALAKEVGSRHVTVNVVAPGFIATDMTAQLGLSADQLATTIPLGRIGDPDDVAGVIEFLASPAARYITGAVVPVDGGLAMGL
jgi:3-oxoacyl-[acyl-carrier protein] reductase